MNDSTVPLSPEGHAGRAWRRPADYAFAADWGEVPVALAEIAAVAVRMPFAFARGADGTGPAVPLRFAPDGPSVLIDGAGRWRASYTPHLLRAYPFRPAADAAGTAVHVDPAALLPAGQRGTLPLFAADGTLHKTAADRVARLGAWARSRAAARSATAVLDAAGLLVPWTGVRPDLMVPDADALARLSGAALAEAHRSGALQLAHLQQVSLETLRRFPTEPADAPVRGAGAPAPAGRPDPEAARADAFLAAVRAAAASE
ncbi:SapC family protein [Rhodovulum sp. YNF3179]|uniref:SapC family protein n=1 Tax=Rhodovulum sp. YNF3179 TaxID=3425127 RepID=UPI003D3344D0